MKRNNIRQLILFVLVIAGISLIYDYPETLLKRPQSTHNWRQCDGASLALNYYQQGMHFFKPQTHMLYSDGYTTGYTSPSEVPILYYFIAVLYTIFGYHEFIFRLVNLLIFFLGLFCLFKLAREVLNDVLYALIVMALIFSSPLLVYYANNFLPNTVALSFTFAGWYYFYRYHKSKNNKTFFMSVLFFGIAGLLKITELTGPVIVLVILLADRYGIYKTGNYPRENFGLKIASIVSVFLVVSAWVLYAKHYNSLHQSAQFSTFTFPIWVMNHEDIAFTLHKMKVIWFHEYFYPATFWFMLACLVISLIFFKRSNKLLLAVSLLYAMALAAFSFLWFQALGDHDYFFIGFYVLPAFLFINFFIIIRSVGYSAINNLIIRVVFILVVGINIYYARQRQDIRYHSWMNDYAEMQDLYTFQPQKSGISSRDTVIFYPGLYIRPLYLMNVKGWVIPKRDMVNDEIEKTDSSLLKTFTTNGGRFFITNDIRSALKYKPFQPYLKDLSARYNSIYIFRLPPLTENFSAADTVLLLK